MHKSAAEQETRRAAAYTGWIFAGTILISAFLLFQVQPLISKYILPWFGGSPAVWTTAMLFFQLALLCGYAYAHLTSIRLTPRRQTALHLGLLVIAAIGSFFISPSEAWKPSGNEEPTLRIVLLLSATVGLPYFVLSTTGPLIQAWFSRAFPGRSPYRLYSLSNVGSLAALLTYPFFFEPRFELHTQADLWTGGFVVFALLCGLAAIVVRGLGRVDLPRVTLSPNTPDEQPPSRLRQAAWLLLPALASLMLLATTNHVCQDVAPVPFLWVAPLSLYLLSFIIAFDHERWYRRGIFAIGAAVSLFLVGGQYHLPDWWNEYVAHRLGLGTVHLNFAEQLVLHFTALFCVCMLCHGELVRLRPSPKYLTGYYLMISAGGALGGIFVSLLAPRLFSTFFEWTIGRHLSYLLAVVVAWLIVVRWPAEWPRLRIAARVAVALVGGYGWAQMAVWDSPAREPLYRARNFYGIVTVRDYDTDKPERSYRSFVSGRIHHGWQSNRPEKRHLPLSYFPPHSGPGRALAHINTRGATRVGIVGMGIATVAAYAKPGDYYRFYEINPAVDYLAREHFTYLGDCPATWDVVLGDGRLALEREESQLFDLVALDAFSGDAVPTHLLTREAFEIYLRHLKPDGIIVVNITNSYLDLLPVVERVAERFQLGLTRISSKKDEAKLYASTDYVLLTNDDEFLQANPLPKTYQRSSPDAVPEWTDRYSNLFHILKP